MPEQRFVVVRNGQHRGCGDPYHRFCACSGTVIGGHIAEAYKQKEKRVTVVVDVFSHQSNDLMDDGGF